MGLKVAEWTVLLCFCAFGIQSSLSFVQNAREVEQQCRMDGGYCIHTIPPPPPPSRRRNNGPRGGAGRRRMGTRTRKGQRPDPRALGAQHTRLPASAQAAPGAAPAATQTGGAPAYPPAYQPPQQAQTAPQQQNNGLFGTSPNNPFNSLFGMMSMFTRKKRQAPLEPMEPHEIPKIRRGQTLYNFLNQHCRKTDYDYGCRREGGICCYPPLG